VPRLIFNEDFEIVHQDQVRDPSPTNRAVSIRCRMFSVMSEMGSFASICPRAHHFRSTPANGHRQTSPAGPVRAKPGPTPAYLVTVEVAICQEGKRIRSQLCAVR
jgi:hypothetical protein